MCREGGGRGAGGGGRLTDHPLDPDDVVRVRLWAEVLEATAEVVPHPLALLTQVGLRLHQEVLRHVHHVHRPEERQEQPLGDPTDAGAAVQGAGGARLVWAFLRRRGGGGAVRKGPKARGTLSLHRGPPHEPLELLRSGLGTGWWLAQKGCHCVNTARSFSGPHISKTKANFQLKVLI